MHCPLFSADKNESQPSGYKAVGLHIVFLYPLCFTPPLSCLLYPLILPLLKPQPPSVPLSTLLLKEEPYHIVGSRFRRLPAQREPGTALLPSSPLAAPRVRGWLDFRTALIVNLSQMLFCLKYMKTIWFHVDLTNRGP